MMDEIKSKKVLKQAKAAMRQCGHPFYPTFDCISGDGKMITSYCLYCIIERLGIEPCSQCKVEKPEDWQDPSKIKWIFNK